MFEVGTLLIFIIIIIIVSKLRPQSCEEMYFTTLTVHICLGFQKTGYK